MPRECARDRKKFDNEYHPGVDAAQYAQDVHGYRVAPEMPSPTAARPGDESPELTEMQADQAASEDPVTGHEINRSLCENCGVKKGILCGYTSRLKVLHARGNQAIWDLGPKGAWMLKDETTAPDNLWKTDYDTQEFLRREKPGLPLVQMHRFGSPQDNFVFTVMSRAKVYSIQRIWHTLTDEEQKDVMQDISAYLAQIRQLTSPIMQKVDGSELGDGRFGTCTGFSGCLKTGRNEEEWLENPTPALLKEILSRKYYPGKGWDADQETLDDWEKEGEETLAQVKANFPRTNGPYVLTHGDLHDGNIFISNDNEEKKWRVSAILDWEKAGYLPWWVDVLGAEGAWLDMEDALPSNTFFPEHKAENLEKIWQGIDDVRRIARSGCDQTTSVHTNDWVNDWGRPSDSACKPWATRFLRDCHMGWEDEHHDLFDVDSTDSEVDEASERVVLKFNRHNRAFQRWINKICGYKSKRENAQ
ncbi:hypothetical protein K402DRAFT_450526 [Aulographum hederae CBS 113979]|uniref:Aminoglycoside phosphotransferase domain-containing protein n=1 Tax=Aulographum hederae CBS 113979 TaxID=1176131 RepID=A0A6G1HF29_9PEZI|nr:hypothetical protein K402DRAFT_450526 [Aulographum hederae CBS 113979]